MTSNSIRRVVITGMGLVCPLGNTLEEFWERLANGRSGIAPLERVPTRYLPTTCGGEARCFDGRIEDFGPLDPARKKTIRKGLKVMCREVQMGVAAAQLALTNAGLELGDHDPDRAGVVFGTDHITTMPEEFVEAIQNCVRESRFDFSRWADQGMPKITPLWLLKYLPNMPASHIAIYNDLRGPNNSLTHREASSNLALGEAYCTILRGHAERMVAGATGSCIHPLKSLHLALQTQLARNGAEPEKLCRPFDLHRTGMVLGEGAGAVVLEELEAARARGATIWAEMVGYGSSITINSRSIARVEEAIVNAMAMALRLSKMTADQIGHIHAHGLSTLKSDEEEARAIGRVFGSRAQSVPVTAAKSYFGNLGAGTGVVEVIASILAIQHEKLFPVLNYETPDPKCPLRLAGPGAAKPGDSVLSLSFTPQGQASCVLVRAVR